MRITRIVVTAAAALAIAGLGALAIPASATSAHADGIRVNAVPADGIRVNVTPADGIRVNAAPADGIRVNAVPADGIRVNAVVPGLIETQEGKREWERLSETERSYILLESAVGRMGTPDEAAGPVLFFCSPLSDYVSGETLIVSGGART